MSYLRFGILLLTLLILSDSFSLVLAQSIYDFKRKGTNVGQQIMDPYTKNIKLTPKIRFRYLYGPINSDSQATRSTSTIIWDRFGIGQSVFKFKTSISGDMYDLENTSIDLSYTFGDTFGDEYTFTLGSSAVYSGKLTITSSDSEIFNSSNVEGSGYFSILGIEYGIFEILLGYQYTSYVFTEIETESTSAYWGSFEDSGGLYVTGIGFAF